MLRKYNRLHFYQQDQKWIYVEKTICISNLKFCFGYIKPKKRDGFAHFSHSKCGKLFRSLKTKEEKCCFVVYKIFIHKRMNIITWYTNNKMNKPCVSEKIAWRMNCEPFMNLCSSV